MSRDGDLFRITFPSGVDGVAFWLFVTVCTMLTAKGCWGVTLW